MKNRRSLIALAIIVFMNTGAFSQDAPVKKVKTPESGASPKPKATVPEDDANNEVEGFDFANGLFERGMYGMAVSEYKKFIRTYPESKYLELADYRIGESLYIAKDYDNAAKWFSEFKERHKGSELSSKADLREGQISFFKKDYDRAAEIFDNVTKTSAFQDIIAESVYYSGILSMKKEDYNEALDSFEKVINDFSNSEFIAHAHLKIGDILLKTKQYERSAEEYNSAVKTSRINSIKGQGYLGEAYAYYMMEDYDKAKSVYEGVLSLDINSALFESAVIGLLSSCYNAGEYSKVIEKVDGLLPKTSDPVAKAQIMYILANSYFHSDDFDKAAEVYRKTAEKYPDNEYGVKSKLNGSWALFKAGKLDAALSNVEELAGDKEEPVPEALYLKAKILTKMGKKDEAILVYSDIMKKFKGSQYYKEAMYETGWIYDTTGRADDASMFYRRFVNAFPDDKRSPEVLLKAGQNNLKNEKYGEAEGDYLLFLEKFPKSELRENVVYQLGSVYLKMDNYGKVIETYKEFAEEFPDSEVKDSAIFWTGYAYQSLERWDEAINAHELLVKDENSGFYVRSKEAIAYSLFQKQEYPGAAKIYSEIIFNNKDHDMPEEIYYWTAEYYFNVDDSERSLSILEEMKNKYPGTSSDGIVLYLTGENYRRLGQIGNAESMLKLALEQELPQAYLERAYLALGRALSAKGDFEGSLKNLEEALSIHKDHMVGAYARFEMGNVKYATGDYEEAGKLFLMVAILYDEEDICSRALYEAGRSFRRAGMPDKEEEVLKELAERYPDSPLIERSKKKDKGAVDEK